MKTLILILFMTVSYCSKVNNVQVVEGETYIYEYAIKKPGQAYVGFIILKDSLIVQDICFTINFSDGKIKDVTKAEGIKSNTCKYSKKENGNIYVGSLLCYTSENFTSRRKLIPDDIYKMISPDFLNMTNKERLKMLDSLVK
ncbi:MAG TPA: hypothetical protein PLP65_01530 [Bacteroidales bacterium]|nr:hypothetical protein [Bacteroidales bacterium]